MVDFTRASPHRFTYSLMTLCGTGYKLRYYQTFLKSSTVSGFTFHQFLVSFSRRFQSKLQTVLFTRCHLQPPASLLTATWPVPVMLSLAQVVTSWGPPPPFFSAACHRAPCFFTSTFPETLSQLHPTGCLTDILEVGGGVNL